MSWDSTLGSGREVRHDSDPHLLSGMWGPFDYRTLGRVCDGKNAGGKINASQKPILTTVSLSFYILSLVCNWAEKKGEPEGHLSDVLVSI